MQSSAIRVWWGHELAASAEKWISSFNFQLMVCKTVLYNTTIATILKRPYTRRWALGIGQNLASRASLDSISWNVLIIIRTRMPNSHAIWPSMWTWWTVDCTALMEAQDISSLGVSLIHCISPREPGPVWQRRCITRCAGQSGTSTYQHFHQYLPANPDQVHRCTESDI